MAPRLLFLCTKNSCRSQIAEGWGRQLFGAQVEVQSAGTEPSHVDPRAVRVMAEVGIDISNHRSKSIAELEARETDWVFTLCGIADTCPVLPGVATRHHPFDDPPALAEHLPEEPALEHYHRVRDEIGAWVSTLQPELDGR